MLRKFLKSVFVLLAVLAFSSAALALAPQDALSARHDSPLYYVMSINDLNGIMQSVFSPANIEMAASVVPPEEAQAVRLIASFMAQIPARSVSVALGMADGANGSLPVFLQIAASMPPSVRPKLDRVADGSASGVEIVSLLLGDAGIMFAAAFTPEPHVLDDGSAYYTFGEAAFAAKDDLFLITLSPDGLRASLDALANPGNRLTLKRRFESPDFMRWHMDIPAMLTFVEKLDDHDEDEDIDRKNMPDPEEFAKIFKAPLEMEMDFSSKPGSFLISTAANVIEALTDGERYRSLKPAEGAGVFLAGGGRLLGVMSGPTSFRAADLKTSPDAMEVWSGLMRGLGEAGITESEVEDLLNGSASVAFGSDATFLGKRVPGGYAALTGREGAAAKILEKLMANEKFTQAVPAAPLKIDGWDEVFMVDPSMVPVPLLFGRVKDTLFVGVVDSASLNKVPEVPGAIAAMFEENLFAAGAFDFAGIWNLLRQEAADPESLFSMAVADEPEAALIMPLINEVLTAELSVPLVKMWASELEAAYMEFSIADVPMEKRLLPKLFQFGQTLVQMPGMEEEHEDGSDMDGLLEEDDAPAIEAAP